MAAPTSNARGLRLTVGDWMNLAPDWTAASIEALASTSARR